MRLKLGQQSAIAAAAIFLGAAAFVSVFAVGFSFGFHPSLFVMQIVWGLLLGGAAISFLLIMVANRSAKRDLVWDRFRETIQLPRSNKSSSDGFDLLATKDIRRAFVKKGRTGPVKAGSSNSPEHRVCFELENQDLEEICISESLDEAKAHELVAWLNENCLGKSQSGI